MIVPHRARTLIGEFRLPNSDYKVLDAHACIDWIRHFGAAFRKSANPQGAPSVALVKGVYRRDNRLNSAAQQLQKCFRTPGRETGKFAKPL
jgi:hypothetical protein